MGGGRRWRRAGAVRAWLSSGSFGKLAEEEVNGAGRDLGQDEGEVFARGRTHGGGDVGPLVASVADHRGAAAFQEPAVADPALVADSDLVLKPQGKPIVRVRLRLIHNLDGTIERESLMATTVPNARLLAQCGVLRRDRGDLLEQPDDSRPRCSVCGCTPLVAVRHLHPLHCDNRP